jgi:hypothetical protein
MNKELLCIFARELVLRDIRELLMHYDGLFTLCIEYGCAFSDLSEATHYCSVNESY